MQRTFDKAAHIFNTLKVRNVYRTYRITLVSKVHRLARERNFKEEFRSQTIDASGPRCIDEPITCLRAIFARYFQTPYEARAFFFLLRKWK